ncbi:hypothetical protein [Bacillus cereus]|uniref:hypothetical protein n=1 Tax=Bacillus cereus TaxID=1396 RepID=UPI000279D0F9|nr:hypothetical protein [Bacillus cereus]EJR95261.1 hypothetical protein IKG_03802 [Bacillus cereus VD200]
MINNGLLHRINSKYLILLVICNYFLISLILFDQAFFIFAEKNPYLPNGDQKFILKGIVAIFNTSFSVGAISVFVIILSTVFVIFSDKEPDVPNMILFKAFSILSFFQWVDVLFIRNMGSEIYNEYIHIFNSTSLLMNIGIVYFLLRNVLTRKKLLITVIAYIIFFILGKMIYTLFS